MSHDYDDIINLPHPVSKRHPQMPLLERAAQFAPFAALTGHGAALAETARLTDSKINLADSERSELDQMLQQLRSQFNPHPTITLVYFQPDSRKAGGTYCEYTGTIKRIEEDQQQFLFVDGTIVPFVEVIGMEIVEA